MTTTTLSPEAELAVLSAATALPELLALVVQTSMERATAELVGRITACSNVLVTVTEDREAVAAWLRALAQTIEETGDVSPVFGRA